MVNVDNITNIIGVGGNNLTSLYTFSKIGGSYVYYETNDNGTPIYRLLYDKENEKNNIHYFIRDTLLYLESKNIYIPKNVIVTFQTNDNITSKNKIYNTGIIKVNLQWNLLDKNAGEICQNIHRTLQERYNLHFKENECM